MANLPSTGKALIPRLRRAMIYETASGKRKHRIETAATESGVQMYLPNGSRFIELTSSPGTIQVCLGAEECGTIEMRSEQTEIK